MPCRVGMTTDPTARRKFWENKHPTLKNWRILASDLSRQMAQQRENREARERGCQASGGGDDPDKPGARWSVYCFEY